MDESNESNPLTTSETEMKELLGMFDAPAFVRRGQDLEYALARLDARCRREHDAMLDMVRLRLRQWTGVATGPDDRAGSFAAPIAALWPLCDAPTPTWAAFPAPPRRRRSVARDLTASVVRFNLRWGAFLDQLKLEPFNRMIDHYNRYYVLEKECIVGSTRLAMRHFKPKPLLTRASLAEEYPALPVPELLP
jgi:hypothetical protein